MSYLVYCILNGDRQEPRRKLRYLGYPQASIMVRACELGAVASETSGADLAPDLARLLAYSKVVELYNRERTVIPMRYGCILDTLPDVRRLLEDHRREYLQLLAQLDGRAEMSARVALSEPASLPDRRTDPASPPLAQFAGRHHDRPGIAYLAERSNYYGCREDFDKRCEEIRRNICRIAKGTFIRCASEYSDLRGKGVFSLNFLVARSEVERFKGTLQPLTTHDGISIAVTGPWPPYNFARSSTAKFPI